MRISKRLPLLVVASSIIAAVSVGFFSYQIASRELHQSTVSKLFSLRDDRHAAVSQYFQSIREDLELIASSDQVVDAVTAFTKAFGDFDASRRFEFEKKLRWIFDPKNTAGNRDRLRRLDDPAYIRYQEVHNKFHPWFDLVLKLKGYNDLFLLSPRGDVIYTVFKGPDFASNLYWGAWQETALARILEESLKTGDGWPEAFIDFTPYEPSNDDPAAFIGRKVIDKGRVIAVIAFQMPIGRINEVMQVTAGMGTTGETYLVGKDGLMRSDSRFSKTSTILEQEVQTDAARKALAGEIGVEIIDNYRDIPVLSAYKPFDFLGTRWAILSEKDIAEIEAPTLKMRETALLIGITACLAIGLLGSLIAYSMTKPLAQLSSAFQRFGETRIPGEVPYVGSKDEIGDLARAFDQVSNDIGTYIAEHAKAESNAAAKEAHLRLAMDNMPGGMIMVDKGLNFVTVNDQYGELFSLPDNILVPGKSILEMLHIQARRGDFGEGDLDLMVEQITEPFRSGKRTRYERHLQGGRVLEIQVAPTPDGGTVAVARDISGKKAAEEKLRKSEETFKAVVDQLPAAIVLKDGEGRYTLANRTYLEWFVHKDQNVVGLTTFDIFPKDLAKELTAFDGRIKETGEPISQEITKPFADGSLHILLITKFPVLDSDGTILAIGTVQTDITERKKAEERLADKNQLLEDLSTKLSHYLSPQVYEQIFSGDREVAISTDRKKLTVFFSDIKEFTATTEDLEPEELTFLLNDYLTKMSEIALEYGATIDKYIGDAMLLFFGDPTSLGVKEDALACVKMAIAMQRRMVELRAKWRDLGHERPIHMRIGINTGYCNVGNFGSDERMDYTIIGGEVNLAARLEVIADADGIMLANETYSLVRQEIDAEEQEPLQVKGISRDVRPFAVQGIFDDLDTDSEFIRAENEAMRLHVDLRKLDKKGRIAAANELETYAARLRE